MMELTQKQKDRLNSSASFLWDDEKDNDIVRDNNTRTSRMNPSLPIPINRVRHGVINPKDFKNGEAANRLYGDLDGKRDTCQRQGAVSADDFVAGELGNRLY